MLHSLFRRNVALDHVAGIFVSFGADVAREWPTSLGAAVGIAIPFALMASVERAPKED